MTGCLIIYQNQLKKPSKIFFRDEKCIMSLYDRAKNTLKDTVEKKQKKSNSKKKKKTSI